MLFVNDLDPFGEGKKPACVRHTKRGEEKCERVKTQDEKNKTVRGKRDEEWLAGKDSRAQRGWLAGRVGGEQVR